MTEGNVALEQDVSPEALAHIAQSTELLLVDNPRMMYWRGEEIGVDWYEHSMPWQYLETLVIAAKREARWAWRRRARVWLPIAAVLAFSTAALARWGSLIP